MTKTAKLPIGIDDFEKLRTEDFYYVDKTGMITELLNGWSEVNLFTRPRRFGKSLNMSMLRYFFEYGSNAKLFEGLDIAGERELCEKYMGKFPVIFISLKDACGGNYETALAMLSSIIGTEAMRFPFLEESGMLSEDERMQYRRLTTLGKGTEPQFVMPEDVLMDSLRILCALLHRHYGQKAVLLIDEYDVPLDKAQYSGYYDEMIVLMRTLYSRALKSNGHLQIAVMTGCLKIAKESIFTGLNNLRVFSIMDRHFDEHFGFSDREVVRMLDYYGASDRLAVVKEWYDGYRFGDADIYCPWDVINYCADLRVEPQSRPKAFWVNTSGNDIIRNFIKMARRSTRREIEVLVNGGAVSRKIDQELTYRELYASIDHLWSVLYMTGYLTKGGESNGENDGENEGGVCQLVIPNREIRRIFIDQFLEWFQEDARKDASRLDTFCEAFLKGDVQAIEAQFNAYLAKTISIRDTSVRRGRKENFYHGILLGLLSHQEDWYIRSNAESGNGFSDILIEAEDEGVGIVIEIKYPDGKDRAALEKGSQEALAQIKRLGYDAALLQDGMDSVLKYGIACNRKECCVAMG